MKNLNITNSIGGPLLSDSAGNQTQAIYLSNDVLLDKNTMSPKSQCLNNNFTTAITSRRTSRDEIYESGATALYTNHFPIVSMKSYNKKRSIIKKDGI